MLLIALATRELEKTEGIAPAQKLGQGRLVVRISVRFRPYAWSFPLDRALRDTVFGGIHCRSTTLEEEAGRLSSAMMGVSKTGPMAAFCAFSAASMLS